MSTARKIAGSLGRMAYVRLIMEHEMATVSRNPMTIPSRDSLRLMQAALKKRAPGDELL
jgi:hypothetical protein